MSIQDMTVVVQDQIEDELAAVPGVADVQVYGDRDKIFRIDVDQNKLASLGFTVADLRAALASVAFDLPAGSITTTNQDLIVRTTADVTTPEEFENIIIGGTTRIRDVATVTLGPDVGQTTLRSDGKTGIGIGIIRQAESNTLDISTGVQAAVAKLQENLPKGMAIKITSDDAVFVKGAVHEVEIALGLSVTMVLIVIYVFLLDWRATLIPGLSMPVAMIGTIAAIYLAGFSVNILTLLALVLATGLVVDDAIVVLENIVRRRNEGMGPRAAAVLGAQEVFFAVIATTLTLVAVFVPISFLPGQTGGLFREFGFVLAMSVLLSCVVALTLCPMLASRMLTGASLHHEGGHGIGARIGGTLNAAYKRALHACLDAPWIVVLVAVLFAGTAFALFGAIRQELTPTEDRAAVLLRISAPQGVSLDYTTQQMQKIERLIQPMRDSGEIRATFENAGQNGSYNSGFMVMTLAPWNERSRSQQEIMAEISQLTKQVPSVRIFPVQPNSLGIRGAGNGLQFALVGNDRKALGDAAVKIIAEMQKDPRFQTPRLSIDPTQPQLAVAIDRERASDLGIDITGSPTPCRPCSTAMMSSMSTSPTAAMGEAGLDHQSDQRSDRSGKRLPEDGGRPLRADVDHRHADRTRRAAIAVARAAAAIGGHHLQPLGQFRAWRCAEPSRGDRHAALAAGQPHPAAGRGRDAGRNQQRHGHHLRFRAGHHPPGARRPVRKLRQRRHHHGDGAARARLRHLRLASLRHQPQRLQPDRPGAAGRRHGQERHPDRRIRQPAARSRA